LVLGALLWLCSHSRVLRPHPFTEDMTLLTATSAAGGFTDFADQKRVRVLRGSEAKVYDVRQFRRDPGLDPKL
jgi:protein involved in polysaccharide export with SLBB domain